MSYKYNPFTKGFDYYESAAGGGGGGWTLVTHGTFTSTDLDITGLNGDTDKVYKIVLRLKTTEAQPQISFNNDSGANYYYERYWQGNNGGSHANIVEMRNGMTSFESAVKLANSIFMIIHIMAKSGQVRIMYLEGFHFYSTNTWINEQKKGYWNNTTDNLTSVKIAHCIYGAGNEGEYWVYKIVG
jgi:hypothetical protein